MTFFRRLSAALVLIAAVSLACTLEDRTDRAVAGGEPEASAATSDFIRPWGEAEPPRAVRSGNLIWIWGMSGTVPNVAEPRIVAGGAGAEARQALANIEAVLAAAGAELRDVAQCSVFVADVADLPAVLDAYGETFPSSPVRTAIVPGGLAMDARVELECTAVVSSGA